MGPGPAARLLGARDVPALTASARARTDSGGAPAGFVYRPDLIDADEEAALLASIRGIEFSEVRMRGVAARRRTAHFGWLYGYETWRIDPGPPVPEFLLPLRRRAADLAAVEPDRLEEVLVTEYPPGAGIGWHRDAPMFGIVVGVSLRGRCRMRFGRGPAGARVTWTTELAPRSAYVLAGAARSGWQHSIPPTEEPRYSVTFRTVVSPRTRGRATPGGS